MRDIIGQIDGVSLSTYSRIEKGNIPDVVTFINLCDYLDYPLDTFVGNETQELFLEENI